MSHPRIAVFARLANGNAAPKRAIEGQATKLSRGSGMHSLAVDPVHDEYFVSNSFAQAILVFRGAANGEEAPLRIIQGPHTKLSRTGRLALDLEHNELVVAGNRAILVFPRDASGDVEPLRVIYGPKTQVKGSDFGLAVDPVNDVIVVFQGGERDDEGPPGTLLIFNRTDQGDVAPRAIITGPQTGLQAEAQIQVYPPRRHIIVAVPGRGQRTPNRIPGFIGVWSLDDQGDVAPRAVIRGPRTMLVRPRGVAYDAQHKEILVADMGQNAVYTFSLPQIF